MPRMVNNTWIDAIYRLPDGNPAIIVEGRNVGTTDWDWNDVVSQMASVDCPVARNADGGAITLSGPVQFGINDTTTHGFTATNKVILWDDQEFAPADLYSLSALGNSGGTTNVTMGIKTGTGDAATGSQGCTISAASTGVRWDLDVDDANLDAIAFYGCSLQHFGAITANLAATEIRSCTLSDGTSCDIGAGDFARNVIVNANTADGVAFIVTSSTLSSLGFVPKAAAYSSKVDG